ncbi:putative leucine-rich repeat-containing protein DDB_G0290503 isoform X4 [Polyergus mexicanus]|uniref:putative leucine-rich repeat-containing protein DDB_G0290503 isoform X4 n=1 Tax=Polyergus mexicanus TaxID=615972 RepID=UPI0038B44602
MVENINNDFLSQFYSQSIERITRTKDHIFNFRIPKKLLKVRKISWVNLFGKYSKEMSDDIVLNVDTLEPDEEEIEKEVCEEEYACEQRIPMRKPATLVQYWINTGNQPYKALLDENELSDTGESLSEKDITLSLHSSVSTIINEGKKLKYKSESSCSSINTAAYILSNANITNKADTIAIIKSAKCNKNINSSKNICIKDIKLTSDTTIQYIENARINRVMHNDNSNVNPNVPDIELCSMSKEYIASKTCDQPTTNIVTSDNTIQPNICSQSCQQTDKMNVLSISERSLDIQSKDDNIQQFNETLEQLTGDDENNGASNQERDKKKLEKNTSYREGVSENIAQEMITNDTSLTASYRKKLYTEEKNDKLSSLKNIDVSQNKEEPYIILEELSPRLSVNKDCTNVKSREIDAIVERLPSVIEPQIFNEDYTIQQQDVLNKSKTFSSNSHGTNKIDNVKSREIKIILERLPASVNKDSTNTTMETEIMNKNNIQQKEILNKFKRHSSNPYGINKTDNVKFRELKITLERLPSNICRNGTNIFADKNIISKNTNLHNNKRKRQIRKISKISACENVETSIRTVDKVDNNYSFRLRTRIKKYNDSKISDTSDIVVDHQVFDKIDSEFPIQYKNDSKVSQANHNTYSVLTFTSSDEDDFVRLIQRPKKRSKFTKDDEILNETDITEKNLCNEAKLVATHKDKYHCRNLRTVIFSSKKPKTTRETFESIKERKDSNGIEIKSSDNTITSLKMYENEKFVFTPNENDNDSIAKNLYKRKKRTSFLNYNKNISNSNERHLNAIGKRNGIDYKNDSCGMLFQTKIFYSDSSDSEENNSYITPICKTHKNSFMHHKLQYHNHDNLEKIFNDSKRYSRKHSSSLNSSFKKHEVTNQIHNIEIELGSTSKEAKISKRLDNEEFNDKINSRIINIKKDTSPCFINDISIRDTTMQKNIYSNISLGKNNSSSLSKNEQISDESKNASAIQQDDVKSTKLLMFQTKTYYGSDSNDSS